MTETRRTNQELMALRQENVPRGPFNITPIFARRAKGAVIEDVEGKEYIDFSGGIGVENVGHSAEKVVLAIRNRQSNSSILVFTWSCMSPISN